MWHDWRTEHPKVDEDHDTLERVLVQLMAVIATGSTPAIVREAISVLTKRMGAHFRMEEAVAGRADPESRAILEADHAHLLGLLAQLSRAGRTPGTDLEPYLDAFIAALRRHEAEVDVPLFHLLNGGEDNLRV